MVIFTFLLAFLCSTLIATVYYFTTPRSLRTPNYLQAVVLSSLIATMILQSIGDNVAAGIGILGALTIINFRTNFKDPRDIIFMFASLGVGIACGSYMFFVAIMGTASFCFFALALQFTPFYLGKHLIWEIRLRTEEGLEKRQIIENILKQHSRQWSLDRIRKDLGPEDAKFQEFDYIFIFNREKDTDVLLKIFENEGISVRRFNVQNTGMDTTD
ncbi:MAG: hypothetical protein OHK0019_34420 [Saprospiraceae bacterium]